ncbi:MAG: glycine cleavage system protein GcvH [Gammaproteobacteria bacterium]
MKQYTKDHEWLTERGEVWRIGVSDHAQDQLGDVVAVELPPVGAMLKAGGEGAVIESVKAASEVYAPVGGEVTAVNNALADNPQLINESPEDEGWLWEMRADTMPEGLMSEQQYRAFVAGGA